MCVRDTGINSFEITVIIFNAYKRRHTQKITPGCENMLTLQKPVRILKNKRSLVLDKF